MKKILLIFALIFTLCVSAVAFASCVEEVGGENDVEAPDGGEEEHTHVFVDGKCECGEEDPDYEPEDGGDDPIDPPHEHIFIDGKCECGEEDPSYVPPHEHSFVDGKCECGEEDPSYVPPHEHSFVDGKCECGEEDPSYVPPHEHSFVDGKCECGEEDPSYVPPHEHTAAEPVKENEVKASCDKEGSYDEVVYCSECGDELSREAKSIGKIAHTEVIDEAVDPDCEKTGLTAGKHCSACGEVLLAQTVVPANGHKSGEAVHENEIPATCAKEGSYEEVVYCSECGDEISRETKTLNKLKTHNFVNGICSVCGSEKVSEGLNFASNGDKTCYVAGMGTCKDTDIVIPSVSPDGEEVVGIGEKAFKGRTGITSIKIPKSIKSIGRYAFDGCSGLVGVYITDLVSWCEISFGDGTSNPLGPAGNLYLNGELVTDLIIPDNVVSLGKYAFYGCRSIKSLTIPSGVLDVGKGAFFYCTELEEIYFNATAMNDLSSNNNVFYNAGKNGDGIKVVIGANVTKIPAYLFYSYLSYLPKFISVEFEETSACTSIGAYAFYCCTDLKSIKMGSNVASIGDYAFDYCTSLTSVTIPSSVTSIGSSAFSRCTGITSLTIPYSVTTIGSSAFRDCNGLMNVTVGSGVISIGAYAFSGCTALVSAQIGNSVTSIGEYAFSGCTGITSVTIPASVASIGSSAFYNCTNITNIIIGNGVKEIGSYAFMGCVELEEIYFDAMAMNDLSANHDLFRDAGKNRDSIKVVIGRSVTKVPAYLFYPCSDYSCSKKIESVEFEEKGICQSIGNYAFYGCGITGVIIPDSVTSIGTYAFARCAGLASVTIGSEVKNIASYAFDSCTKLVEVINNSSLNIMAGASDYGFVSSQAIEVHKGESKIVSYNDYLFYVCDTGNYLFDYLGTDKDLVLPKDFKGASYEIYEYAFSDRDDIISVVISDSVIGVGECAFSECKELVYVTFGNGITSIEARMFYNCTSLKSVTIPNGVTHIKSSAFYNCTSLTDVTIPDSVTVIALYAFRSCTGLLSVAIPDDVLSVGNDAFRGCTGLTNVVIGNNVTLSTSVFADCTSLKSVTIGNGVVIPEGTFNNTAYYNDSSNWDNSVLYIDKYLIAAKTTISGSYDIKDGTICIVAGAFKRCKSLTNVTVPDSVISIGSSAFENCTGLTSVTIGNGVASIGEGTFFGCTKLTDVTFENPEGWWYSSSSSATSGTSIAASALSNPSTAATYLKSTYVIRYWNRS